MSNKTISNLERIIAKIDNDFNPDNSDWIPRVGAWCLDAMGMLGAIKTVRKKIKLEVNDRIAQSPCPINDKNIKVYDKNGCEVEEMEEKTCCNDVPSTGECNSLEQNSASDFTDNIEISDTIHLYDTESPIAKAPDYLVAETILVDKSWPGRYRINEYNYGTQNKTKNYVLVGDCKLELNFDTNYICIEYDAIQTQKDSNGFEVPVIPNNALLIEAIVYFCMYKMLCRGYKHPVFNLQASQYGTNPYYIWTVLKEQARRSVIADEIDSDENISKLLRSNMYIESFDPRR